MFTVLQPSPSRIPAPIAQRPCRHLSALRVCIRQNGFSFAASSHSFNGASKVKDDFDWGDTAFPSYMASRTSDDCSDFEDALVEAENRGQPQQFPEQRRLTTVWAAIRREAAKGAAEEPMLSSFLHASIMAHDSLERALAFVLANRLANTTMLPTQLLDLFFHVITTDPSTRSGALADIEAFRERDPACGSYSQALLYYKGFHAIQTHRIAHALWNRGQRIMALALQSRMSEVLAVDIHPAAKIGKGLLLDHGTGVVIGETAVIGNNVSLLQNVTLGGTGKEVGDRHPKLEDNVLVGANATILGNIVIGRGSQVAAGSLVLKPVPPNTIVAGTPAKEVGKVKTNPAASMQQIIITDKAKYLQFDPFLEEGPEDTRPTPVRNSSSAIQSDTTAKEQHATYAPVEPVNGSSSWAEASPAEHGAVPKPTVPILRVNQKLGFAPKSTPLEGSPPKTTLPSRNGSSQSTNDEHVEATRDDREAARMWKNSPAEPEYFI